MKMHSDVIQLMCWWRDWGHKMSRISDWPVLFLPGLMQLIPQTPSHRHFFFLLLQSSSDEHFLRHFCSY